MVKFKIVIVLVQFALGWAFLSFTGLGALIKTALVPVIGSTLGFLVFLVAAWFIPLAFLKLFDIGLKKSFGRITTIGANSIRMGYGDGIAKAIDNGCYLLPAVGDHMVAVIRSEIADDIISWTIPGTRYVGSPVIAAVEGDRGWITDGSRVCVFDVEAVRADVLRTKREVGAVAVVEGRSPDNDDSAILLSDLVGKTATELGEDLPTPLPISDRDRAMLTGLAGIVRTAAAAGGEDAEDLAKMAQVFELGGGEVDLGDAFSISTHTS